MKTTQENNKLIAEFMGVNPTQYNGYEMYGIIECIEDGEEEQHFFTLEDMLFNSSWDWLMSVVEKIEGMGFKTAIKTNYVRINPKEDASYYNYISWVYYNENGWYINQPYPTTDSEPNLPPKDSGKQILNKLEATYKACVQFIEWWNEQNAAEKNSQKTHK